MRDDDPKYWIALNGYASLTYSWSSNCGDISQELMNTAISSSLAGGNGGGKDKWYGFLNGTTHKWKNANNNNVEYGYLCEKADVLVPICGSPTLNPLEIIDFHARAQTTAPSTTTAVTTSSTAGTPPSETTAVTTTVTTSVINNSLASSSTSLTSPTGKAPSANISSTVDNLVVTTAETSQSPTFAVPENAVMISDSSSTIIGGSPCPFPPKAPNSKSYYEDTPEGFVVTVTCSTGYVFHDGLTTKKFRCVGLGSWDPPEQQCKATNCSGIPSLRHARVDTASVAFDTIVTVTCDVGHYFTDGSTSRSFHCLHPPDWSPAFEDCKPVTCPPSPAAPSSNYGMTSQMTCDAGERTGEGRSDVTSLCTASGRHTVTSSCRGQRCPPPPYYANSVVESPYSVDEGDTITYICLSGHRFEDGFVKKSLVCDQGLWRGRIGNCIAVTCPPVQSVNNATASTDIALYGTVVEFRCNHGYRFQDKANAKMAECLGTEKWNTTIPDCQEVLCPPPSPIPSASLSMSSGRRPGDEATYSCEGGKRFIDGRTKVKVICEDSEQWSPLVSGCAGNRCGPLMEVAHALPSTTNTTSGVRVWYQCLPGYIRLANNTGSSAVCSPDLKWEGTLQPCSPVQCPSLRNVSNIMINTTDSIFETHVNVSCIRGHVFKDGGSWKVVRCNETAQWNTSVDQLSCEAVKCPVPRSLVNTYIFANSLNYGSVVRFVCPKGWHFGSRVRTKDVTCTETTHWSETVQPCTEVECKALPTFDGSMVSNTSHRSFNTFVNYSCSHGYEFQGSNVTWRSSYCTAGAEWTPEIIACAVVPVPKVIPTTKEAPGSQSIGQVALVLMATAASAVVVLDAVSWPLQWQMLKGNLGSFCK